MIEIEKNFIALITNHMQPFVEKANELLKTFKELGYTKDDINYHLELFLAYELKKVFYYCITIIAIGGLACFSLFVLRK